MTKEEEKHEYHLSICLHPWLAILEPLNATPETPTEEFNDPLALLERLERQTPTPGGVK